MTNVTWTREAVESVANVERRRHVRVRGPFDGRRIGALVTPVQIYDLSEGGCFVDSPYEQPLGTIVVLDIELPGEGWIRLTGETLHVRPDFGFAVRFVEMTPEISMCLKRALALIISSLAS
jgi:hypothetical protein